jgi:hypothetical protein
MRLSGGVNNVSDASIGPCHNIRSPYLVVTFLADRTLQATPFDSEEEAEAFIERAAPSSRLPN